MSVDIGKLGTDMLQAAVTAVLPAGKKIHAYGKAELAKLAETVAGIELSLALGSITPEQASALLEMQRNATQSVLATVEGMGIVAAESAVNAALSVGVSAIETALGITLA
ncbi:MAG: hypothetical protein ACT4TC_07845 [Myxococcaceae bacterium]